MSVAPRLFINSWVIIVVLRRCSDNLPCMTMASMPSGAPQCRHGHRHLQDRFQGRAGTNMSLTNHIAWKYIANTVFVYRYVSRPVSSLNPCKKLPSNPVSRRSEISLLARKMSGLLSRAWHVRALDRKSPQVLAVLLVAAICKPLGRAMV